MSKRPNYYIGKYKSIEAFDVVLDFQEDNYNLGTALTYIMRAGKKPGNPITQDIEKAIAHLKRELEHQLKKPTTDETTPSQSNSVQQPIREDAESMGYWTSTATNKGRSK
jgi:hypothetical protein